MSKDTDFMMPYFFDIIRDIDVLGRQIPVNYDRRNSRLIEAYYLASIIGVPCGFRIDSRNPEWPVLFFELPTGQVSWHLPQHICAWDGHTDAEKHQRIKDLE